MDPPNKRRRLAPKLPDPPPSPKKAKVAKPAQPPNPATQPAPAGQEQAPLPSTEPSAPDARASETAAAERHDFETFAKHLQDAAMYIYRQGQKLPYANVSALLLRWEDDVASSADLSLLERALRDRYNFATERWGIPSVADPGASLCSRIASFLDHAGADHLLIIYYIGHGHNGVDNQLYWSCTGREDSPRLKWGSVRTAVEDAPSDILLLLDSCAPRHMPISGSNGVKQAIAAHTFDAGPRELGTRTFTSYLVEALQKLGNGRPFNSQHLYDDIVSIQQAYEYHYPPRVKYNASGKPTPVPPHAPLLFTLTPTKTTIDLAPLPRGHASPQAHNGGAPGPGDEAHQARDAPVISPAAVADMVFSEPRLLVCTTFVGDPGPDMASFNQWISDTPSLASKVAVEGMFLGPPTVLLISIPQSLWAVIQDAKICFSLGYINSHNLINLYDGLMKASSTLAPRLAPTVSSASARDIEDGRTLLEAREAAVNNPPLHHKDHAASYPSQQPPLPPPHPSQQHRQISQQPIQPQQQLPTLPPIQHTAQHHQSPLQQFHSSPQHQSTLPPPQLPQLPQLTQLSQLPPPQPAHAHQTLPLPIPQRQNSQVHSSSLFHEIGSSNHFDTKGAAIRRDSIPQLQDRPNQRFTSPPHTLSLPRIVSRSGSPALAKDEREESEEMKEAAEQLKALSHVRPLNGNSSPPFSTSSHLLKIAQDVIKCQADDSTSEDTDMKNGEDAASPAKKTKPRKDYRFKTAKSQDGQPARSRSKSDMSSQSLPSLQAQTSKPEVQCDWCSHEPFKDHSSLRKHVASAHTRPFPCAFSFAGCSSTFGSKNEWKRHIASQHLCLQYYRCSDCSQGSVDGKGNEFNRKDLFTQHLRRMHAPQDIRKAIQKRDTKVESDWEEYVKEMQRTCCIVRRLPPQRSACPRPDCNRLFEGRSAWDEWTEHVGRHMENGEGELLGVDDLLVSWALDEGIIARNEDLTFRLCNPMGSGSGGGGASHNGNGSSSTATNGNSNDHDSGSHPHSNSQSDRPPKGSGPPHISVPVAPATVHASPSSQPGDTNAGDTSAGMPPTPPPTTTRLSAGADEKQEAEAVKAEQRASEAPREPPATNSTNSDIGGVAGCREATEVTGKDNTADKPNDDNSTAQRQPETNEAKEMNTEPLTTEDLSGFQSITVAAIAAAAALQQQEQQEQQNEKVVNGAMDVDG